MLENNPCFVYGIPKDADDEELFIGYCTAIPESSPIADPVGFVRRKNGIRNTTVQASVYDAMMAELHGDKARRAEKWRKTHDRCKKSKDDTPADRKRNKMLRVRKLYGLVFEDGKGWYYEYGSTGSKQTTEPDAEIVRNLKYAEMEKSAYAELLPDPEHYVGKTTLSGMMRRLWKTMMGIQAHYEQYGCTCFEQCYYEYDGDIRNVRYYAPEYYDVLYDYQALRRWADVLEAKKCGVTIPDTTPEDVDYFCTSGKRTFERRMKEFFPQPQYVDEGWRDWRDYEDKLAEEMNKRYWESLGELDAFLWDDSICSMGQDDDDWEDDWYE